LSVAESLETIDGGTTCGRFYHITVVDSEKLAFDSRIDTADGTTEPISTESP